MVKTKNFSSEIGKKNIIPPFTTSIQHCTEVLTRAIRQLKKLKVSQLERKN